VRARTMWFSAWNQPRKGNDETSHSLLSGDRSSLLVCAIGDGAGRQARGTAAHGTGRGGGQSFRISDPSAVVFLKNTRTNAVRSYIADDEGNYRFSGLDPNVDYEVHAEKDGAKSAARTVSSFDSKKEIVLPLKIEKKKT